MENDQVKKCNKCNEVKPLSDFELRKDTGKYRNTCKECISTRHKEWRLANKEELKQKKSQYYFANKEKYNAMSKEYRLAHKEELKRHSKEFREQHKEELKQVSKDYYESNKDMILAKNKVYREKNKDKIKEHSKKYYMDHKEEIIKYHKDNKDMINKQRKEYKKQRRENDTLYKLTYQVRGIIYNSFTRRGQKKPLKTEQIIGCKVDYFIQYLLQTYKDIYGYEWDKKEPVHIDHIVPLATATNEKEILQLCNYKNLQLLKAKDNINKSDKLDFVISDEKD